MIRAFDTCAIIDLLRGKLPLAFDLLKRNQPKDFVIPTIVEAELLFGIEKSPTRAKTEPVTKSFLATFEKVGFDSAAAAAYVKIRANLEKSGARIGPNDLLIAAICLAHDYVLVTSNTGEFSRVQGLHIENWAEISLCRQLTRTRFSG